MDIAKVLDTVRWDSFLGAYQVETNCHTQFSVGNQVHTYMHARIKFHAYSDI
jgi:hypothetical protein